MAKKATALNGKDQSVVDEFVLRIGGKPESRAVLKSLIEVIVSEIGKPIAKVNDVDVLQARSAILESDRKQNYQRKMIFNLRRFFLWYWKKAGIAGMDISGITLPATDSRCKTAEDMISPQQIETLLKACHNARDRCFLAMHWDGSNRPSELLKLRWSDLKVDEYGYTFETDAGTRKSKTGKNRHIRLTMSIPYIEDWRRNYPGEASGNTPVFVSLRRIQGQHKIWTLDSVQFMFETLRTETGIKTFKPSHIRPSRITDDVKNGYPESYIKMKNWGNLRTPMMDVYTNLNTSFIDEIALEKAGQKKAPVQVKKYTVENSSCPSCGTLNVPGSVFCHVCKKPMTEAAQKEQSDLAAQVQALQEQLRSLSEMMIKTLPPVMGIKG